MTPEPKASAQCGHSARWDPCGGRSESEKAKDRPYRDCVATNRDARWKLELRLRLRQEAGDAAVTSVAPMPRRFGEATTLVELVYGKKPAPVDMGAVKSLARGLEKILGVYALGPPEPSSQDQDGIRSPLPSAPRVY